MRLLAGDFLNFGPTKVEIMTKQFEVDYGKLNSETKQQCYFQD